MPAERVTLDFSGKTTVQSIKEVVSNPVLSDVKSLVRMGTNPLSIFSTLSSARSNMIERERYEKTLQSLRALQPGDSEDEVAKIVRPEDVAFTSDGMVMAYPRFSLDFYVNGGTVKVLQQPSFHRLGRLHAAIFTCPICAGTSVRRATGARRCRRNGRQRPTRATTTRGGAARKSPGASRGRSFRLAIAFS